MSWLEERLNTNSASWPSFSDLSTMSSTTAAVVAVSTFLSCLLCITPLILQLQARNYIVSILIASTLLTNIFHSINALIWPTKDPSGWEGQGLCDVEVKLRIGLEMTVTGSIACLFRQLSSIADTSQYPDRLSRVEKRNTGIFQTSLCGILPLLRMILSYVVQPRRYWVFGIFGCTPTVDTSWPSYALVLVWPLVVSLVALRYIALATLRMVKHSREMSRLLPGGQVPSSERKTRKLVFMALFLYLIDTPTRALVFWGSIMPFLVPYSWSRIHPPDWAEKIGKASFTSTFLANYASSIVQSIFYFYFLGCSPEATAMYRSWLDRSRFRLCWASVSRRS